MLAKRFPAAPGGVLILTVLLAVSSSYSQTTTPSVRDRLAKAMKLTNEKKLGDARAEYEAIAKEQPEQGVPALARFIALTCDEEDWNKFLDRLKSNEDNWNATVRASAYSSMGEQARAAELLASDEAVLRGDPASATLLLARILRSEGDEHRAEMILGNAILSCTNRESQLMLFDAMAGDEHVVPHDDLDFFARVMDAGIRSIGTDEEKLIRRMDPLIISLMRENAGYFQLRDSLLAKDLVSLPGTALFLARMIQREERPADALLYLDPIEKALGKDPFWPALAQAKIQILRSLGRNDDAKAMYDLVLARGTGTLSSSAIREAAGVAIATKDADQALKYLAKLDVAGMTFDERDNFWILKLMAAGLKADIPLVMDTYATAADGASLDQLKLYNQAIFGRLRETAQHVALEKEARVRLAAGKGITPRLWILVAAAAAESHRTPNQVEALYQFAQASPSDPMAYEALSEVVAPLVESIAKAPKESVLASKEEIDNLNKLAEQSLMQLVRLQPLDPQAYISLINLYKATNVSGIPARISSIIADSSTSAEVIGNCAYALSMNGFPNEALVLYNKALKIEPDNMQIQMNRAACYTRIDRLDDARKFYAEILEKGDRNRRYHIHELIGRIWAIDEATNRQAEGIAYLKGAVHTMPEDWRDEGVNAVANLFAQKNLYDEAEPLFREVIANGKDEGIRIQSCEDLGQILVSQKRFDDAIKVFAEAESLFAKETETVVFMKQARAQVLAEAGRLDESVALLKTIPSAHPKNQLAQNSIFLAAQLCERSGRKDQALQLYRDYLDSKTSDFALRATAQKKINERGQQTP
ncbi:tetratricopeptide repeat protein [Candidatus Sumerlaeota bacterium]|nr:tetratricopeptide repeat protein [Candidatus Sumerlaeota bacterium]